MPSDAKALQAVFPTVDVIQGSPVTAYSPVEGQGATLQLQSNEVGKVSKETLADSCSVGSLGASPGLDGSAGKSAPFLIELFCGTAGVCAQFRLRNGRSLGIDHHLKRTRLKSAAVQLDLTQPWVQEMLEREIRLGRVDCIHLGPPCGTASRARNIPIKRKLLRKGAPNPQPLRSSAHPLGFPWLKGVNRAKVQAANALYDLASRIALLADQFGVLFTIENPHNSLMWETPFFKPLLSKFYLHVVDACEYGSDHKKATAFLANFDAPRLKQRCQGAHQHAAWAVRQLDSGEWAFDTAKEAEYPTKLAHAIAASFMDELANRGKVFPQEDLTDHAAKISAESQPRRTRGPLLMTEFKTKVEVECEEDVVPPEVIPEDADFPWQGIPVGSKRLDVQPATVQEGCKGRLKAVYGVYFSPQEFVQHVQQLRHPFDVPLQLDEANMSSIAFILSNSPADVARHRAKMLGHYVQRAKDLSGAERQLHEAMDDSIKPVMASKRLLLFKEMLSDAGVNDPRLFDELCSGFKLVGDLLPSGQFKPQWKPAALGVEQLRQTAVWAQKAVVGSCRRVLEDREIAEAVWAETMEQAAPDKLWVKGPFSSEDIEARHGPNWIPSKRFGVKQNGKIRPVDDFSQYLVNASVTCHEKIDLEGIDSICSTARFFMGAMSEDFTWNLPGEDGLSSGLLATEWHGRPARDLVGRCLDLKQAYKQLVRHPEDSWASILAVINPADEVVYYFEAVALPFGAVSSVLAFNRSARALRTILAKCFKLVVTNFFDDFCQLELSPLSSNAWSVAEAALELLGWRISMGEEKRRPFAKSFEILGAIIPLPEAGESVIKVENKPSRLLQLNEQVEDLKSLLGSTAPRSKLESLKGRMLYAAGHTYGKCTQLACQLLHKVGGGGSQPHSVC